MSKFYIVGNERGKFINDVNEVTANADEAKIFSTIGDEMRCCIEHNKETFNFKVIPL